MTIADGKELCPRCAGTGRVWQNWRKRHAVCVRCDGSGMVAPRGESLRDFRKRVIDNG